MTLMCMESVSMPTLFTSMNESGVEYPKSKIFVELEMLYPDSVFLDM